VGVRKPAPAPAPAPAPPQPEMKPPSLNIDDLLRDIKSSVQPAPAPQGPSAQPKKNKAGSTGKSVTIKL